MLFHFIYPINSLSTLNFRGYVYVMEYKMNELKFDIPMYAWKDVDVIGYVRMNLAKCTLLALLYSPTYVWFCHVLQ